MVAPALVGALVLLATVLTAPRPRDSTLGDRPPSPQHRELEAVLQELHRAWNPRRREAIARRVRRHSGRYRRPLLWFLARPDHELLGPAIELAAALQVGEARPLLERLVDSAPPKIQGRAVAAAERIEAWSTADLQKLLAPARSAPVLQAALAVADQRSDPPLRNVYALMGHPDQGVRTAALEAIPPVMSPGQVESLLGLARAADGEMEPLFVQALGRTALSSETESFLTGKLRSGSRRVRLAALEALASKNRPLQRPLPVWELVDSGFALDPVERAKALACLESTRSTVDVSAVLNTLWTMPPLVEYFAGRYLVVIGDRGGARILLDLLQSEALRELEPDVAEQVRWEIRGILGQITGTDRFANPAQWESLLDAERTFDPAPLPGSRVLL